MHFLKRGIVCADMQDMSCGRAITQVFHADAYRRFTGIKIRELLQLFRQGLIFGFFLTLQRFRGRIIIELQVRLRLVGHLPFDGIPLARRLQYQCLYLRWIFIKIILVESFSFGREKSRDLIANRLGLLLPDRFLNPV